MSKKVTIIRTAQPQGRTLTEAERQLKYEQWANESDLDDYHFENFYNMTLASRMVLPPVAPEMMSLLIKSVAVIADPIVVRPSLHHNEDKKPVVIIDDDKTVEGASSDQPQSDSNLPYYVITQFNHYINAFIYGSNEMMTVSPNTPIMVVGMVVYNRFRHDFRQALYPIDRLSTETFLRQGLWNTVGKSYASPMELLMTPERTFHMFDDEKSARSLLLDIFGKVRRLNLIRANQLIPLSANAHYNMREPSSPHKAVKYPKDPILDIISKHHAHILNVVSAINHNVADIYYVGTYLGTKHQYFIKSIDELARHNEEKKVNRQNVKQIEAALLKTKKIQLIAMDKFGKGFFQLPNSQQVTVKKMYDMYMRQQTVMLDNSWDIETFNKLWSNDESERRKAFNTLKSVKSQDNLKDVLCPHLWEILTSKELGTKLQTRLIKEYSAKSPIRTKYFCKICGEELGDLDPEIVADRNEVLNLEYSLMEQLAWSQALRIINNHIAFKYGNDMRLIRTIVGEVSEHLEDVEYKLKRVQTNSEEYNSDMLKLHAAVNIYAILIKYMLNRSSISFKNKAIKIGGRKNKSPVPYLTTALQLIHKFYNAEIANTDSSSTIKKMLAIAYNSAVEIDLPPEDKTGGLLAHLASDPIYAMVAAQKNVPISKIQNVLGIEVSALLETDNIYQNIKSLPESDNIYKHTYNALLANATTVWKHSPIPGNDVINEYLEELNAIRDMERPIIENARVRKMPNLHMTPVKCSRKFKRVPVDISLIYGNDGKKVQWDIAVISINGKRRDVPLRDFPKMIGTPDYKKYKIVDYKSSSGAIRSRTNLREVQKSLELVDAIESFYNFYQFKCPAGILHKMNGNSCTACKITHDNISKRDISYYQRWKSTYEKQRVIKRNVAQYTKSAAPSIKSNKYSLDTSDLSKLAKFVGISYNMIFNMGHTESYFWDDIKSTVVNPAESGEYTLNRLTRLHDYYNAVRRWTILLASHKSTNIPFKLNKIIEKYNMASDTKRSDLPILPELESQFIYTMDSTNGCNYVLHMLSSELVKLYSAKLSGKYGDLVKDFIKFAVMEILHMDNMFSQFNKYKLKNIDEIVDVRHSGETIEFDDPDAPIDEVQYDDFSMEGMDFEEGWESNLEGSADM